jgi:hypothetical protein
MKGIQPNIDRLVRKHKEVCEVIKCSTLCSKQKLELQCERELADRIQTFERNEQINRNSIVQRNDLAQMLSREQNEHALRLTKLKDTLAKEEENTRKAYQLELQTLSKEHDAALSKAKTSKSTLQLKHHLATKQENRRLELESKLDRIGRDVSSSKQQWTASWSKASSIRVKDHTKKRSKELLEYREKRVDELIRSSILEQTNVKPHVDEAVLSNQLVLFHRDNVSAFQLQVAKQIDYNEGIDGKISAMTKSRNLLQLSLLQLEEEHTSICNELEELLSCRDRKITSQEDVVTDMSNSINQSIQCIDQRRNEIEHEIIRIKENINSEARYEVRFFCCQYLTLLTSFLNQFSRQCKGSANA